MLEYLIKKTPVAMKRATVRLVTIKSHNALLRMLLVCIHSYLKSILRYKYLILDTQHPDDLYLCQQGREDPWLIFGNQNESVNKQFCKKLGYAIPISVFRLNILYSTLL
jgi:hypothetical protein